MYIFRGSCPVAKFCHVPNSLCIRLLRSPILAALLHSTRAVGISESLWRRTRNGITELSLRASPIFGWTAITLGIGPYSSCELSGYCNVIVIQWYIYYCCCRNCQLLFRCTYINTRCCTGWVNLLILTVSLSRITHFAVHSQFLEQTKYFCESRNEQQNGY